MPCDSLAVARKNALIPMVFHALSRMQWALLGAKRLDAVGVCRREAFGVRQLAAALFLCPNNVSVPISHFPHQPDDRSCDAFRSRKPGHRTYTGWVRRRIAALLPTRWRKHRRSGARPSSAESIRRPDLTPVSIIPIRRPDLERLGMRKQRVCPHIGIRGVPLQTSATADWNKGQFESHAAIRGQNPNNEPVTLSGSPPKAVPL
ncbi:MAG: hypothetical protein GX456_06500 [Verrucomicrobia bacterium]|nr:hypothetical protein [Verrucomicrobiota bacterium]